MCKDCGCGGGHAHSHSHTHVRADGTVYTHDHHGEAPHDHAKTPVTVKLEQAILSANDAAAAANRVWFAARGIVALNLISSPGSGKTRLLEKTLEFLSEKGIPCAVLVGDQYGEADAVRLKRYASSVTQIQTGERCHLNAEEIMAELPHLPEGTRILFIENVGNLVCPVAFDLGENAKIALLSTAEGEEKPVKYPALFASAALVLLTKMDIAEVLHWNRAECTANVRKVNPDAKILPVSAQSGDGMKEWFDYLIQYIKKGENQ